MISLNSTSTAFNEPDVVTVPVLTCCPQITAQIKTTLLATRVGVSSVTSALNDSYSYSLLFRLVESKVLFLDIFWFVFIILSLTSYVKGSHSYLVCLQAATLNSSLLALGANCSHRGRTLALLRVMLAHDNMLTLVADKAWRH